MVHPQLSCASPYLGSSTSESPPAGLAGLHAVGPDGFDSVVGREGQRGVDEWVFFNSSQLLPCFLVDRLGLIPAKEAAVAAIRSLHLPWEPSVGDLSMES